MKLFIVLLSMIFCHIIDDWKLQGQLAFAKQKSWWEKNYPDEKYKYDWIMAMLLHVFSWTFMIHIPIFIYAFATNTWINYSDIIIIMMFNMVIHFIIDHEKCNRLSINLILDQSIHLIQIVLVWLSYAMSYFGGLPQ